MRKLKGRDVIRIHAMPHEAFGELVDLAELVETSISLNKRLKLEKILNSLGNILDKCVEVEDVNAFLEHEDIELYDL